MFRGGIWVLIYTWGAVNVTITVHIIVQARWKEFSAGLVDNRLGLDQSRCCVRKHTKCSGGGVWRHAPPEKKNWLSDLLRLFLVHSRGEVARVGQPSVKPNHCA